ncbi:MAG: hypothetical protein GXY83_30735 [Rhodopirellula sp.]|nr:hypothetical protein [Rhodopirellula sp.]
MPKSPKTKSAPKLRKLIEKYYADLRDLEHQHVLYEMGTRPAFHALLAPAAKPYGWTLIAEHEKKLNGRTIRPDGTFKDEMNLVRGYWEAKDTADDLDAEIAKKRKAGYPTSNMIFEDTATAVLFQHGQEILRVKMTDPPRLAELLTEFFRYVEPEIEQFEHAVDEFKQRVPDLAEGLKQKIDQAHKSNKAFQQAFDAFFDLCKTSLNPNLSAAAVDEMLIQHILTERLIREIFDNPEFVRRNVIAAEVEKVMLAMTSQSFDRNTYLRELDRFEHAFFEQTGHYEPFERLCFESLDLAEHAQPQLAFMTAVNTARVERQRKLPIRVIIENPLGNDAELVRVQNPPRSWTTPNEGSSPPGITKSRHRL